MSKPVLVLITLLSSSLWYGLANIGEGGFVALPAWCDRHELLTLDGDAVRWLARAQSAHTPNSLMGGGTSANAQGCYRRFLTELRS